MFSLIKREFIELLSFSSSSTAKYLSLNDEPCMVTSTLIDSNPVELKYYLFMVSPYKCSESCNSGNDLQKIYVSTKAKNINVKAFSMITNRDEVKTSVKHTSCDCKDKFNSTACNTNQKWNNKTSQCECKIYGTCKKIIVGILTRVFERTVSIYI